MDHDVRERATMTGEELCMAIMRDASADPDVRISAAHVALWLQHATRGHREALGWTVRRAMARREAAQ
ncbi:MAG: hypothetical protein ACTHL8_05370 [Burkholderiaceae bacterium]